MVVSLLQLVKSTVLVSLLPLNALPRILSSWESASNTTSNPSAEPVPVFENALTGIVVMLLPMVTFASFLQPANKDGSSCMIRPFAKDGMVISSKLTSSRKTCSLITVNPDGKVLAAFVECTLCSLVQLANACFPNDCKVSGSVIVVRFLHSKNAEAPIVVILDGKLIVSKAQPENSSAGMVVTAVKLLISIDCAFCAQPRPSMLFTLAAFAAPEKSNVPSYALKSPYVKLVLSFCVPAPSL